MGGIDQVSFEFDPSLGAFIGLMTAVMVFGVALDLRWEQIWRILKAPRAPAVGLLGQFIILPAAAFGVGLAWIDEPSIALGLLLVACCPGGAVSNYLTHLGKGDVATSVSMTAVSTAVCVVVTPLLLALWGSMNPAIWALMREVAVDPKMVTVMFLVTVGIPIAGGMVLRARRPRLVETIRPWIGRLSVLLLAIVVGIALSSYFELVMSYAREALAPVVLAFAVAVGLGQGVARLVRLSERERRAVMIEVGGQNVAIGAAIAAAFFSSHAGVFVTVAAWGVCQQLFYIPLVALVWARRPPLPPR